MNTELLGQMWTAPIEQFSREWMNKTIGFGHPIMQGSMFKGFNRASAPDRLDCTVWFDTVPSTHSTIAIAATQLAAARFAFEKIKTRDVGEVVDVIRGFLEAFYTDQETRDGARMNAQVTELDLKVKRREILKPAPKSAVKDAE